MLTNDEFLAVVERIMTEGGDWSMSIAEPAILTYDSKDYELSDKHADIMWTVLPHKCN